MDADGYCVVCVFIAAARQNFVNPCVYKFANIKQGGVRGSIALPTLMCVYM
jgi:hypothetical protein